MGGRSEVRGQRAAKGEERTGGGWRLFISGCTAAKAGTWVRRVRREESGGRSQHAQPGDGSGEWLRPDTSLPSSQSRAPSPAPSPSRRSGISTPRPDLGGVGPPAIPVSSGSPPGLARGLLRSFPAPRPGPAPRAAPSRPFIDSLELGVSFWTPVVCWASAGLRIIPWPFALVPYSWNPSPRGISVGRKWLLAQSTCFTCRNPETRRSG